MHCISFHSTPNFLQINRLRSETRFLLHTLVKIKQQQLTAGKAKTISLYLFFWINNDSSATRNFPLKTEMKVAACSLSFLTIFNTIIIVFACNCYVSFFLRVRITQQPKKKEFTGCTHFSFLFDDQLKDWNPKYIFYIKHQNFFIKLQRSASEYTI